jgi:hypothetical protein
LKLTKKEKKEAHACRRLKEPLCAKPCPTALLFRLLRRSRST